MLERIKVPEDIAIRVNQEDMRKTVEEIIMKMQMSQEDSRQAADLLIYADLRGIESHGVSNMMRKYIEEFNDGTINPNPKIKIITFQKKLCKSNIKSIIKNFDVIVDGTDNFKTRFLLNDFCIDNKKILISGAISKFDGHIYTFNFNDIDNSPCLRCFIPRMPANDRNDCEHDGVIGTLAGIVGSIQANEVVKEILKIGLTLCGYILIIDALKLTFRKVKLNKNPRCRCNVKNY